MGIKQSAWMWLYIPFLLKNTQRNQALSYRSHLQSHFVNCYCVELHTVCIDCIRTHFQHAPSLNCIISYHVSIYASKTLQVVLPDASFPSRNDTPSSALISINLLVLLWN